jgi:hypothetical protein
VWIFAGFFSNSSFVTKFSPKIKIGDTAEYTHKFTEKDVKGFADIVGV